MDGINTSICTHERTEVRRKTNAAGKPMFKLQCLDCGEGKGEWISHSAVKNPAAVPAWDDSFEERCAREFEERRRNSVNDAMAREAKWWEEYNAYLDTPKWKRKRMKVLERDGICQACLERPAVQAHHLTYDHQFNEPLFDLVGVCLQCHEAITRMDRERRLKA